MNLIPLNLLNFFISDVRDGLGPFLAVFLQQNHWEVDQIGWVMTISGLTGMIVTTPISTLADIIYAKRAVIVISAVIIILACCLNYFYPFFYFTLSAQILTAIVGAAIPPAINAITLSLVGQKGFDHQLGRNESYNHGGNAFSAMMSGVFSYYFGLKAVFALMVVWTLLSIITIQFIRPEQIDYKAARGLNATHKDPRPISDLLKNKHLLVLAITVTLFHLANAAMLPLLSQAMVARGTAGNAGAYTALTIIVAQVTMIPMALLAGMIPHPYILVPLQMLDGVGAGLMGVAVPGLAAKILDGSGRINTGIGIIMTVQGVGASLSPSIAGMVAKHYHYDMAFLALSLIAVIGLCFWLVANSSKSPYKIS